MILMIRNFWQSSMHSKSGSIILKDLLQSLMLSLTIRIWNILPPLKSNMLTHHQVRWSEYFFQFNILIKLCPGKLGGLLDTLTCRQDCYPKKERSSYSLVNLANLKPVFSSAQLSESLWVGIIIDSKELHSNTYFDYLKDSVTASKTSSVLKDASANGRTLGEDDILQLHDQIYVSDFGDL